MGKTGKKNSRRKEEVKKSKKVLLTLGLIVVLLAIFFLASSAITKYTGYLVVADNDKGNLGDCLDKFRVVLYINTEDTSKTLSKINLDYLDNIEIMNCLENKEFCSEKKISSFPTWTVDGYEIKGGLDAVLGHTGC